MSKSLVSIKDVIEACGGSTPLGAALGITSRGVDAFCKFGVRQQYWTEIMKRCDVTVQELHDMNERLRAKKK